MTPTPEMEERAKAWIDVCFGPNKSFTNWGVRLGSKRANVWLPAYENGEESADLLANWIEKALEFIIHNERRSATEDAVAQERERCARIAESRPFQRPEQLAQAIRSDGKALDKDAS